MKFENDYDAIFYLKESIYIHEGQAVTVYDVEDGMVSYRIVSSGEIKEVKFDDFNSSPFPTGYLMTSKKRARYIARLPARQWRQGLTSANSYDLTDKEWVLDTSWFKEIEQMAAGNYPSFKEAVEQSIKKDKEIPFDRDFCVSMGGELHYKTERIGKVDGELILLDERMEFMKEYLEDTISKSMERVNET